jgi:hypothetical protein
LTLVAIRAGPRFIGLAVHLPHVLALLAADHRHQGMTVVDGNADREALGLAAVRALKGNR